MPPKKQIQLKTAFRKRTRKETIEPQTDNELVELEKSVQEIRKNLEATESEYFQRMRALMKRKHGKLKRTKINAYFPLNPQKLVLVTDARVLTEKLNMLNLLTGMQVATFYDKMFCTITFQVSRGNKMLDKHGIKVDLSLEPAVINQYSLPLGFKLNEMTSNYEVIMDKNCIMTVYSGLMAYYERLHFLQELKDIAPYQVQMFYSTDASEIEFKFPVVLESAPEDGIQDISVKIVHDIQDSYVRKITVEQADLNECYLSKLKKQLDILLDEPMHIGFRKCFLHQDPAKYQCTYRKSESQDASRKKSVQQMITSARKKVNNKDQGYNSDSSDYSTYENETSTELRMSSSSMRK